MLENVGNVVVGWDSLTTYAGIQELSREPKVIENNGTVIGVAGVVRGRDLLEIADLPRWDAKEEPNRKKWVIRTLVPALQSVLGDETLVDEEEPGLCPVGLLVVVGGKVFSIDARYHVFSNESGIYAMGSGSELARGALAAQNIRDGRGSLNENSVLTSLDVASSLDPGTGGPLNIAYAHNVGAYATYKPKS